MASPPSIGRQVKGIRTHGWTPTHETGGFVVVDMLPIVQICVDLHGYFSILDYTSKYVLLYVGYV